MMTYELWESESGNTLAAFEGEAQAFAAVVARARHHGPGSIDSLALVRVGQITVDEAGEEDAEMEMLVAGAELLARAMASTLGRPCSKERPTTPPLASR
jgi:hypothetical protein